MSQDQFHNRELSWLAFNARVLQEASDPNVPLLERLRFLGIFSNNLDEFFRVRYATIKRIDMAGKAGKKVLGGYKASRLLKEITQIVIKHQTESLEILSEIQNKLQDHNIHIVDETQVGVQHQAFLKRYFLEKVSPALVTIMLNDIEKVPNLKDSAAYLAVKLVQKLPDGSLKNRYTLVQIPTSLNRFVVLPAEGDNQYVILLDDLIRYNLDVIFNIFEYESISAHMIKITRDAELDLEGDLGKSYIEKLMSSVKDRREGDPVRFVYDKTIDQDTLDFLLLKLGIDNTDSLIPGGRYHNRRDYMKFPDLGAKHLLYEKIEPLPVPGLKLQGSLFKKIAEKDYLQFAPYQTFSYTVKFLREAALDPNVKSIKITIYRLADVSHIASSLINAAKNGKQVTVSIELQARFDEANNVKYSEKMQREGVKIIFGVTGLKVHAKSCVIDRIEHGKVKRYGFISTGNFNENTAKIYTDYTLFTSHSGILKDINKVFDFFEVNYKIKNYKHLIVSPHYTRNFFYKKIDEQIKLVKAGKECGMMLKMNSLSDYLMISKLYEASRAGVKIKLIVRGICCLIPEVKGMSENIKAISIVDKFLEHPRLYIFKTPDKTDVYISSADLMTRNLDHRVEITCPIYDENIKTELINTFNICWKDNVKARNLASHDKNEYERNDKEAYRSQFKMYDYYKNKLNSKPNN
ncbi:polyphosphate kinase 1 [Mesohalobacter halotolerans]|uniref:Polyphosphate kinase n=1 Tax=Mesohalobacter halotolerans TaxID=1883405 RepID=A0A4U5TNH3_9FLAO|nr:polyphosphate kinase 1 [Mesohalobacter halotolerans]MBS3737864.1 polyphosphate kinase 1 [Psychroflexus sp.]TKS55517.1 polyphosphate kinase 1 [Mesohalobacter halotolerans]